MFQVRLLLLGCFQELAPNLCYDVENVLPKQCLREITSIESMVILLASITGISQILMNGVDISLNFFPCIYKYGSWAQNEIRKGLVARKVPSVIGQNNLMLWINDRNILPGQLYPGY